MDGNIVTRESPPKYKFDPTVIPKCQANTLMAAAGDGMKDFFSLPGTEENFQAWLLERGITETPVVTGKGRRL